MPHFHVIEASKQRALMAGAMAGQQEQMLREKSAELTRATLALGRKKLEDERQSGRLQSRFN